MYKLCKLNMAYYTWNKRKNLQYLYLGDYQLFNIFNPFTPTSDQDRIAWIEIQKEIISW